MFKLQMVIPSKGKGTPQAFCVPQLFGNVLSPTIQLEPSFLSCFFKSCLFYNALR